MQAISDWATSIQGTEIGRHWAIALALISAISHASFGALQKSREDPFLIRAGVDLWFFVIWLPIALFLVPWPTHHEWWLIAGIFPIHTTYKLVLTGAYRNGDFTVIYPIARGSAPMFTALVAGLIFQEKLAPLQWLGVVMISSLIMLMSVESVKRVKLRRENLPRAIGFAVATGFMIMVYSIYDAHGVRESRSPFIFLAWFYVVDGFLFPTIAFVMRKRLVPRTSYPAIIKRGMVAAPLAIISFTAAFLAMRIGKVGEVTAIRETSVIFAAFIGYLFLGEHVSKLRFGLIILIAFGAIFIGVGA